MKMIPMPGGCTVDIKVIETYYEENFEDLVRGVSGAFDNFQDAEDAVQDAFTKAIQYAGSFNEDAGNFEGWFRRILSNCIKDVGNAVRNQGMSMDDEQEDVEDELNNGKIKRDVVISDDHEVAVDHQAVTDFIKGCRPKLKNILTLYFYKDLYPREIGQALGIRAETVSRAIWRFNKRLRGGL